MAQKKDRSRFTIKFRENDPAHDMTIRILEKQGQRNIAPFLVNAVLHYVKCSETPDLSHMLAEKPAPMVDKNAIEEIVWGILSRQEIVKGEGKLQHKTGGFGSINMDWDKKEERSSESIKPLNMVNGEMRVMIAKTLSAFRND